MGCDYFCQTSTFNAAIFLAAAISFAIFALRHTDGRRYITAFGFSACLGVAIMYALNVVGVIPTPVPTVIGRNAFAIVGIFVLLFSMAIWHW